MDKKRFSVFPMLWGTQPAEWQEIIELAQQAEALGYYSFTIPHVPILPYAEERPPDGVDLETHSTGVQGLPV